MIWDENKHPRDDEGKFTFKNGESNSNKKEEFTNILYQNSNFKKQEKEYKNVLLSTLGNSATQTDILYGTTKELEEKVKKYGLQDKLRGNLTGKASSVFMSPVNRAKDNNRYMTPIEEMYKRQKGYSEIWEGDKNFKSAMVRMFDREKGHVNNKYDLGGETNLGITKNTLDDYKKKHFEFKDVNINNITKNQAARIYYDEYWKKSGADKIKDKDLAYVHFDATVNHGLKNSRKFLEQSGGNFDKYIEIRRKFYNDIVKNKPEQKNHIKGWMNRLKELEENKGNLF